MEIKYSKDFIKHFQKRIPAGSLLDQRFQERLGIFITNRTNPIIKDHKLVGKKQGYRSFSITADVRVIYSLEENDSAIFIDIGTHNQVYGK